jgi:hypothetical protein
MIATIAVINPYQNATFIPTNTYLESVALLGIALPLVP